MEQVSFHEMKRVQGWQVSIILLIFTSAVAMNICTCMQPHNFQPRGVIEHHNDIGRSLSWSTLAKLFFANLPFLYSLSLIEVKILIFLVFHHSKINVTHV